MHFYILVRLPLRWKKLSNNKSTLSQNTQWPLTKTKILST